MSKNETPIMERLAELLGADVTAKTPASAVLTEITDEMAVEKYEAVKKTVRAEIEKLMTLDADFKKAEAEMASKRKKFDKESEKLMKRLEAMLKGKPAPKHDDDS